MFKKARLCTEFEIEEASTSAWSKLHEPAPAVIDALRVEGMEQHKKFRADRLEECSSPSSSVDEEDAPPQEESKEKLTPSEFFDKLVKRTPEQCAEELSAPQRSIKWLEARKLCITASQFGCATGKNPYSSPDDLVKDKLWNTFKGNAATQWGTEHEPHAKEAFVAWYGEHLKSQGIDSFEFLEENLMKFADEPWMAVSPDGIVKYEKGGQLVVELVEFKCPAYLRNTINHPYNKHPKNIPPYYFAQMQGIMGYLNAHHKDWKFGNAWFVVWQPHQMWLTKVAFDASYYNELHEQLQTWYFTKMLPAFTHKHNNMLAFGDVVPHEPVVLSS